MNDAPLRGLASVAARVPERAREPLREAHRTIAQHLAAAPYRRKYDGRFLSAIHAEDDLFHYGAPLAEGHPAFRHFQIAKMYFGGGDWNARDVERVLDDVGHPLREADSLLEFAAGFGRLTRHFVHSIDPARITVSDIDERSVAFLSSRLGVRGFASRGDPAQIVHGGRYEVIVVVSLFSHLPHEMWGAWLRRLVDMLAPGGVLLFTTHNYADADPDDFEQPVEGFLYRSENETRGRLDPAEYGAAFVTSKYVQRAVADNIDGRLIGTFPHALLIAQDAYVVERTGQSRIQATASAPAPGRAGPGRAI
jgi:2-polyprenyl-3-methyl-5-hydroxy-6-metoxy-1,4-benzoquinol methylase